MLDKRGGGEGFWYVIGLVLGAAVGIILLIGMYRFTSTERAEMVFFGKDAAMITDAMIGTPGDWELYYPQQYPGWYARYNGSDIVIQNSPDPEAHVFYRHYIIPREDVTIDNSINDLSLIYFVKYQDNISIEESPGIYSKEEELYEEVSE